MIYLDNGATTFPKPEVVYQAMDIFARTGAVNAGRGAYAAARAADQMIKNVRTGLISLMDAREQAQVVLTPFTVRPGQRNPSPMSRLMSTTACCGRWMC